jgi:hypothetical protein
MAIQQHAISQAGPTLNRFLWAGLWALVHFSFTRWLFPARMVADHVGVSNSVIRFWLTPWQRTDEHLPMSHIAEVTHSRGLIWDPCSLEEAHEPGHDTP